MQIFAVNMSNTALSFNTSRLTDNAMLTFLVYVEVMVIKKKLSSQRDEAILPQYLAKLLSPVPLYQLQALLHKLYQLRQAWSHLGGERNDKTHIGASTIKPQFVQMKEMLESFLASSTFIWNFAQKFNTTYQLRKFLYTY